VNIGRRVGSRALFVARVVAMTAVAGASSGGASPPAPAQSSHPGAATPSAPAQPAAPQAARKPAPVTTITNRLDLRAAFNLGKGKVRVVAYLSPTCSHCIQNAARLELLLEKMPTQDFEMHAVWIHALQSDKRTAVDRATLVLCDPRVQHYWDPEHTMNAQLLDAIEFDVGVRLYDIFLLYDRQATWKDRVPRPNYWMSEYRGCPGPVYDANVFLQQITNALKGAPIAKPQ